MGLSGPPGGFPGGGPPDGFPPGPPPDGFSPGGMGGPPNGMGKSPFPSLGPPPGFGGSPPGFPSGPMPPGMGIPPTGPSAGKGARNSRPKLTPKRQLKSPRKGPAPPNVKVGPGLEGFKYRSPYERMNTDPKQQEIRTFTQAFQNVSVQEGMSSASPPGEHSSPNNPQQQHPPLSSIQTVSACASQVPMTTSGGSAPGLPKPQDSPISSMPNHVNTNDKAPSTVNTTADINHFTNNEKVSNMVSTNSSHNTSGDNGLDLKKSPASSKDSRSPLDLSHPSDPGYCTDNQQSDLMDDILDLQENNAVQPRSIRNTSRNGHLSTSSDSTNSSLQVCGEIPCFDDSISPLTLGDMDVIPKDFNFSQFDLASQSSSDLNKSPLQNSISMSPSDPNLMDVSNSVQQQQAAVMDDNRDSSFTTNGAAPGFNEAMMMCADQETVQGYSNSIHIKNSPQHQDNSQNSYTDCNFVNTSQFPQRQHRQPHLSPSSSLSSASSLSPQSQNRTFSNTLQQTLNQHDNPGLSRMSMTQPTIKMSPNHGGYENQNGYQESSNMFASQEQFQFANNSMAPENLPPLSSDGPRILNSCLLRNTQQQQLQLQQQQDELASQIQQQQMNVKSLTEQLLQLQRKQQIQSQLQSHQLHQQILQRQQQQQQQMQRQQQLIQQRLQQQRLLQQKEEQLQVIRYLICEVIKRNESLCQEC